jgi:hypothetical protein
MRKFIRGSLLIVVTGMMGGCGSGIGTNSATPAAPQAGTNACLMQAGGINVLRLTTSADVKCVAKDGSLHISTPQYEVEMWLVRGAQTMDEAIARVDKQIVDEFKDFKAFRTTDLTVAGSPAKRMLGSGHEADDGDAGQADVIVFKVGDHVFIACTHGEGLAPIAQQAMLTAVQTAQTP